MKTTLWMASLLAVAVCLLALPAAHAAAPLATVHVAGDGLEWQQVGSFEKLTLTISGPDGLVVRREFPAGTNPTLGLFGKDGKPLADGSYTYELSATPILDRETRQALAAARQAGDDDAIVRLQAAGKLPRDPLSQSGSFAIAGSAVVRQDLTEPRKPAAPAKAAASPDIPRKDQVIPDDLIVQGSACIGFDCVNNESFGFDTVRLKENSTRIKFEDTSAGSFPANDWQLTANDSASGGANKFSIEDITGSKVPFTVTAGAATNSIFLDSTGRLGLRTSTPVLDVHINTSNTPAMRMEQNSSGGFTAQTWDVAGNEANFFVRDVTGGSRLPFRIRPGAPTSSVDISASGNVGVGTASPDAKLDIENSTSVEMRMTITNSNIWRLINDFNGFGITFVGSGLREFNIGGGGNVTISGTLTQGSSREIKDNFLSLDPKEVLSRVSALPLSQWSYKTDGPAVRHIGPMAEDFHQAFGLGTDDKHIAPSDQAGVALLAVQGLNQVVQEKDKEIAELKTRLQALEKMVETLAARQ
ncbi:MAG TPA: tail fiber domain-containing protein [Thermoanaerobaculia bacterium]|nr:tail fiber domain-containing protein [Thermoanaerobaculia bacterium]